MSRSAVNKSKQLSVKKAINFLRDKEQALLTSDKEGGFVVMPVALYEKKALQSMEKILFRLRVARQS